MSNRRQARECALQALYYADSAKFQDIEAITSYLEGYKSELQESFPFCQEIALGTYTHQIEIDKFISTHAKNWTIERMSVVDRAILRMATFEIVFHQEKTPIPAIIDEAIELAKRYSTDNSSKFINGLLDQIKKERK